MRVLLDTHTFLWFIEDDPQLSSVARAAIEDEKAEVLISAASLWEMAIKYSIGKLNLKDSSQPFEAALNYQLKINEIQVLDVSQSHVLSVATLPFHHKDPFDRLIAVQSLQERLPIISADTVLHASGDYLAGRLLNFSRNSSSVM